MHNFSEPIFFSYCLHHEVAVKSKWSMVSEAPTPPALISVLNCISSHFSQSISLHLSEKHLKPVKSEVKVMTLYGLFFYCSQSLPCFYLPFSAHCTTMCFCIQIPNISDFWLVFLNKVYSIIPSAAKFALCFLHCIRSFFSICIAISLVQTSFKSYLQYYYTVLLIGLLYSATRFVHLIMYRSSSSNP